MNGRRCKLDAFFRECLLEHGKGLSANAELFAGFRHELQPYLHTIIRHLLDPLHFQGLDDVRPEFGILLKLNADTLDGLAHLLEVAVIVQGERNDVDDPVTAEVLHRAEFAEGNDGDRAAVMAQADRSQRETFYRPLIFRRLDVFADAKGIVEQIEDAGDDVLDECLGTEADGYADDTGARQQRSDLNANGIQDHQEADGSDCQEQHIAKNGKEGIQPLTSPRVGPS